MEKIINYAQCVPISGADDTCKPYSPPHQWWDTTCSNVKGESAKKTSYRDSTYIRIIFVVTDTSISHGWYIGLSSEKMWQRVPLLTESFLLSLPLLSLGSWGGSLSLSVLALSVSLCPSPSRPLMLLSLFLFLSLSLSLSLWEPCQVWKSWSTESVMHFPEIKMPYCVKVGCKNALVESMLFLSYRFHTFPLSDNPLCIRQVATQHGSQRRQANE